MNPKGNFTGDRECAGVGRVDVQFRSQIVPVSVIFKIKNQKKKTPKGVSGQQARNNLT
jgi:hypothetical protein